MKQKTLFYLSLLFFILYFKGSFAQDYTLTISSHKKIEISVLKKINYLKKHKDTTLLFLEIHKIADYLKNIGYFTNTIDSLKNTNTNYTAYFSLHEKIDTATIKIPSNAISLFKNHTINNNTSSFPIENLNTELASISNKLDMQGKSFSKVKLNNITIKNKTLFADLKIHQSKKRIIDSVIIKGYENFPKSYLKHYFKISPFNAFNQKKINEISNASKNLPFIKEIKPPEVLFTKDTTLVYLYLKKKQNNSFDGLIGFTSKEDNKKILFNGYVDLKLNNVLDRGEKLELFWNSIGEEKQEFQLSTEIPYIFNSRLTPELSFSIYKQDSTFINTKFNSKLSYDINPKLRASLLYNSESSNNLKEQATSDIATFNNFFTGLQIRYHIPKNDFFYSQKFFLEINPSIGKRTTENTTINQFKIETSAAYIWDISHKSKLYVKNSIGYLNSDAYITNELFRIGGAKTIRGINEQSIFTNSYNYFNIEYRYLTSKKSYLYSITDVGNFKTIHSNNENILTFGFGYLFTNNNSQININTAIEVKNIKNNGLQSILFSINWKNYF